MRKILAVTASLILAASACGAPAQPRSATSSPASRGPATIPAPTGSQPVGTTSLHVKDDSRRDPWNPDAKARELKVTLWYPTGRGDGERASYMTPKESELALAGLRIGGVDDDILSKTRTNAVDDAEPTGAKLPLVVLSPGFTRPASMLTSLAEDLASRGYLVAGIDHTYENYATTLSGGRVAECIACDSDTDPGFGTRVAQGRAADVSFVLDELTSTWKHADLVDRSRIAMVGQSIGGASAMATMLKDSRIRAGANLDGTMYARLPAKGFDRPFLLMGAQDHAPDGRDPSWDRDWKLLTGWRSWLVLPDAEHQSFTDSPVLEPALGIEPVDGVLSASRSVELTRTYVAAFLDQHLRGKRQDILQHPSHGEVKVCATNGKTCR